MEIIFIRTITNGHIYEDILPTLLIFFCSYTYYDWILVISVIVICTEIWNYVIWYQYYGVNYIVEYVK